ncbi:MAG: hypothetical protein Q8J69_11575 [Sphingobacteriaceae bacterium]|nr:hypothetical protein [Sphingobacteriaceae bacterium]
MKQKWMLFGCVCLVVVTTTACGKKATESGQLQAAVSSENYVKVIETPLNQPVFEVKSVRADWVNGFINIAITSKSGSMLQVNGIAEKDFKTGRLFGDAFRLVYLPGGFVAACTSSEKHVNYLQLLQKPDQTWLLSLQGKVFCESSHLEFDLQVGFDQPERSFVAPNH